MNIECIKALRDYEDPDSPVYHKSFYYSYIEENFSKKEIAEANLFMKDELKAIKRRHMYDEYLNKPKPKPAPTIEKFKKFYDAKLDQHFTYKSEEDLKAGLRLLATKRRNQEINNMIARNIQGGMSTHELDPDKYLHYPGVKKINVKQIQKDSMTDLINKLLEEKDE